MIIPVRCYSCGKIVGNKWQKYCELLEKGLTKKDALNELKLKKYCCRNIILSHVNLIDKIIQY
jgi:DNA-directed RNA polymerase subunit N (RpoN/RPB10)|tara:strand:- start:3749 stop:3937 length:189 start_codon:yes stop_codon:yes gene_type:complete